MPTGIYKHKPHTKEHNKKISEAEKGRKPWNTGKKLSLEHRNKIAKAGIGRKWKTESRIKASMAKKGNRTNFWKGGVCEMNKKIRRSVEYRLWRESVFARDNYTCRFCGQIGGKLNADHIKRFADYPELRFAIDNGRTLCVDCHKKTDTFGR
jgi:hypothetical protein